MDLLKAVRCVSLSIFLIFISIAVACGSRRTKLSAVVPGDHFYRGEHCISRFHEPRCPIGGACLHGDNCLFWGTGVYHWHTEPFYDYMNFYEVWGEGDRYHVKAHRFNLPNVSACKDTDVPGSWFYGQWRADQNVTGCAIQRVPRTTIKSCLHGKKVLFIGDSYVRQMMLRIIFYLRGFEEIAEHYFHSHGTYSYFESAYDNLTAFDNLQPIAGPFRDEHTGPLKDGESFRMNFFWGLSDPNDIINYVRSYVPDVVVIGGFCAQQDSQLKPYVDELAKIGQETGKPSRMFIEPLPEGAWTRDDAARYANNIRAKVASLKSAFPGVNIQVFPIDKMAAQNSPYYKNEIERTPTHYQCTYFPQYYPDLPEQTSTIEGFKAPPSRDCRDLFDYELVTMMFNSMCL